MLLTAEGEPLLADFNIGCCSKVEGAGPAAFFGGTLPYMAPEHIEAFNPEHDRAPGEPGRPGRRVRAGGHALGAADREEPVRDRVPAGLLAGDARTPWPPSGGPAPPAEALADFADGDVPGLRDVLLRCLAPDPEPTGRRPARWPASWNCA